MNYDRFGRRALFVTTATIALSISNCGSFGDALSELNNAFKDAYTFAAGQTLAKLRASVPVLVNRFDQIALYRPGVQQPDLFSMDTTMYSQTKSVAHSPAALYARLSAFGLGTLDDRGLEWLATYQSLLPAAEVEIAERADVPAYIRTVQTEMLADIRRFVP